MLNNFFRKSTVCEIMWINVAKRTGHSMAHAYCMLDISSPSSLVICQTTGPKPLPKRFPHIVRSRSSSFNWQYPLLSLRSSSSFLRLLPRLLVTYICPFIFPSITCFRRQFLRKMWPIYGIYIWLSSYVTENSVSFPWQQLPVRLCIWK